MNEQEIKQLIRIVEESDIDELEISRWGRKIRITKRRLMNNGAVMPVQSAQPASLASAPAELVPEAEEKTEEEKPAGNLVEIKSPMVGTFYRAPAPDADDYVVVGDTVEVGDVLCIIEAMKLMNELEAEQSGKIVDILVENAKPVQYNQPMFVIDVG